MEFSDIRDMNFRVNVNLLNWYGNHLSDLLNWYGNHLSDLLELYGNHLSDLICWFKREICFLILLFILNAASIVSSRIFNKIKFKVFRVCSHIIHCKTILDYQMVFLHQFCETFVTWSSPVFHWTQSAHAMAVLLNLNLHSWYHRPSVFHELTVEIKYQCW